MEKKKIFLLDAMALIYRAYYALIRSPRITTTGLDTSAAFGFTNTLYDILKNEKPSHIGVVFDSHGPTFREEEFEDYKANREATPDGILSMIPYIKRIIDAFGIPVLEMQGFEADDIIGTLAKKAEKEGFEVFMMTSDKDFGQLLSDNIHMYRPARMGEKAQIIKSADFCQKYGIKEPEQFIDILGLWGDAVDNIPGVPGVGEKTAQKLIEQFGSIENMLENTSDIKSEKLRQRVEENAEQAKLSKMLATIVLDVPVDFKEDELKYKDVNLQDLKAVFDELEFRTIAKRVFTDFSLTPPPTTDGKKSEMIFSDGDGTPNLFSSLDDDESFQSASLFQNFRNSDFQIIEVNNIAEAENAMAEIEKATLLGISIDGPMKNIIDIYPIGFSVAVSENKAFYFAINNKNLLPFIEKIILLPTEKSTYDLKNKASFFKSLDLAFPLNCHDMMLANYLNHPEMRLQYSSLSEQHLKYEPIDLDEIFNGKKHSQNIKDFQENSHTNVINGLGEHAILNLKLKEKLCNQLQKNGLYELYKNVELPLAEVLYDMERAGVSIDKEALLSFSKELEKQIKDIENQVFELSGEHFNIASPKQLGDILFEKLLPDVKAKRTKTKQYQTGEEVLKKIEDKHPVVPLVLEFRGLTKLKSTYVDALPPLINPQTQKIHATFNQAVTATGRLSSTNPNMQNLPIRTEQGREIRKAVVSSGDDFVLISADYSQIELRVIASLSGDKAMSEAFEKGLDIHSATAARVFGIDDQDVDADQRRKAKAVNFGIIYGISSFGLAEQLGVSRFEAADLIKSYFVQYPGIKAYIENQVQIAKDNGYVETILHRRRYLSDINSKNAMIRNFAERNAVNAPIQGSAADMIKVAMINIHKRFKESQIKSSMIMQIHDELVFDVHKSEIDKVKEIVLEEMKSAIPLNIPVEVEIEVGKNWLEAH